MTENKFNKYLTYYILRFYDELGSSFIESVELQNYAEVKESSFGRDYLCVKIGCLWHMHTRKRRK